MATKVYTLEELENMRNNNLNDNMSFLKDVEFACREIGKPELLTGGHSVKTLSWDYNIKGINRSAVVYYEHKTVGWSPVVKEYIQKTTLLGFIDQVPGIITTGTSVLRYAYVMPDIGLTEKSTTDFIAPGLWQEGLYQHVEKARQQLIERLDLADQAAVQKLMHMLCIGKDI